MHRLADEAAPMLLARGRQSRAREHYIRVNTSAAWEPLPSVCHCNNALQIAACSTVSRKRRPQGYSTKGARSQKLVPSCRLLYHPQVQKLHCVTVGQRHVCIRQRRTRLYVLCHAPEWKQPGSCVHM